MLCFGLLIMLCQQPTPPVQAHAAFCDVAKPIIWSSQDTRKTKEQADAHNRVGKELCGWGKR